MAAGRVRRGLLPLPVGLGMLALAGCAPMPGQPTATAARRAVPVAELAARLPAEAAGFRRGATIALAQAGEEGRETAYRTLGRTAAGATVTLARLPGAAVPEGAEGPAVEAAFAALVQEATRPLPQQRLQDGPRFTLDGGLRCTETEGAYGRERVEGLLCAGGLGGGLLRLRVTMPQQDPAPADARAFASSILAALRVP
ncbi:hypothetical protein QWZ14_03155 [Paeniroseomonas aquatica]|uniref:DUF1795 domain-containing protein n=1 Tax=Paeniroseomonas aquatica TaxID=373043 RepID=A0ABT8A185_9PROT|nr:hypothetical protein [Paeniroseomonas aquatica]MDN3563371.1 hypothetical protein [Paeniroseomonas aquatica]